MAAIFLVVVVGMIATFAVNVGTAQRAGTALGLLSTRASFAAESGLEWAVATVTGSHACVPAGTTFNLTGEGLLGFRASVECAATSIQEGASTYTIYALDVVASHGTAGTDDFVQRRLSAQVTDGGP